MNLVYQIPNKLYYINNFLDYNTYKKLHYDVFRNKLLELKTTKDVWQEPLKHGHKNYVEKLHLDNKNKCLQKIKILLETNPFHKVKIKNFNPLIHSMKDGSGINWHHDGVHAYGITYYLNRRWNDKFGGEFLFKDEFSNGFIPLIGNSLVILKSPFLHKVSPVQKPTVPRKTIQIFIENYEE